LLGANPQHVQQTRRGTAVRANACADCSAVVYRLLVGPRLHQRATRVTANDAATDLHAARDAPLSVPNGAKAGNSRHE
jgi:hypothetical protein